MFRLTFITMLLLLVGNVANAKLLYRYTYVLQKNDHADVCIHMVNVFNQRFGHLWDYPPAGWTRDSAQAEYKFPALPEQQPNSEWNGQFWYSAFPTSPEFSAIHWKQGRAVPGGCPAGKTCAGQTPEPILVAHFDFDNDGSVDTVIKHGFFSGYDSMFTGLEYLDVWRGQGISITGTPSLRDLGRPKEGAAEPVIAYGIYLRPFIYRSTTYVASYSPRFSDAHDQEPGPPPYPSREDMLIQQYSFTGLKQKTTRYPEWSINTVCDLQMKRLSDR